MQTVRRFSFNHATFGPAASFRDLLALAEGAGVGAVGVWLDRLDELSPRAAGAAIRAAGLGISGVNRGGFFTGASAQDRTKAIDATRRQIDATAELGAPTLIIVAGGLAAAGSDPTSARAMVHDGLAAVAGHAANCGIRLAIEPFHPALTGVSSVVNTLDLALDLCDRIGSGLGVATDVIHLWWDPNLYPAIVRAGDRILAHHLCDWAPGATDARADRALMGDGIADAARLTAAVLDAEYEGWLEIEIFSKELWKRSPAEIAEVCLGKAISCRTEADRLRGRGDVLFPEGRPANGR